VSETASHNSVRKHDMPCNMSIEKITYFVKKGTIWPFSASKFGK
jgi:hypothetical protein